MMLDAKRLLDQFLGGNDNQGFGNPQSGGPQGGQSGGGLGGGLGDIARQVGGGLSSNLGGIGGGALAGGLAGLLLGSKSGRKLAGNVAMMGGMAAVGALAYHAYRNYQAGKEPVPAAAASSVPLLPPPAATPFNPSAESEQQHLGRSLMRAMIAAAKADGHVDAAEQANIFAQMDRLNLSAEDKAFVIDELRKPLDVDAVANGANTPEQAAEIYAASLLAIDVDNPSERGYLGMLAARLKLDDKLVEHLHATIESATEPVKEGEPVGLVSPSR
jgi:uncharacterized membrane protein YebE (DUF533 family)